MEIKRIIQMTEMGFGKYVKINKTIISSQIGERKILKMLLIEMLLKRDLGK